MSALAMTARRLIVLVMIIVIVISACSDDRDTGANTAADSAAADEPAADEPASEPATADSADAPEPAASEPADEPAEEAAEEPAGEPAAGDSVGGLAVPTSLTPADIGRDIIFRATISVEVDDVAAAGREAQAIIEGLGGIVFGQETVTEPEARTVLTFKVFPADFSTALERLAGLGDLVNQQVSADDVTERIVDLESRINTAAASVERLRGLLDVAGDVNIIVGLENQLLQRETTLEQLRGQLRTIQDQVDLATITLTITPSPRVTPRTGIDMAAWLSEGDDDPCLGRPEITVEPDATVHMCLEIENTGESTLTDIDLDSGELRLRLDELTVIEGDTDQLDPGERLVVTATETLTDGRIAGRVATRRVSISAMVTATPVDDRGDRLADVTDNTSVFLVADEDDSLPGFADAIGAAVGTLVLIGSLLLVAVGAILPFIPLVAIVAYVVIWNRRRQARQRAATSDDT